ncbi:AprI/Inh family metalloprotease inhibitor [Rhizobium tubonense]|uniref:Metalloprotease n=1 Tax=Rhizobium tubonense TaxID=484088 RepID=A0A2W4CWZ4_9HYPH|nr:AprI/Inh family metalloprotease inhibitor [Rhizobium tubonense]PZM16779.1 metalloprotease [Rhizobium tubonense]
MIRSLTFLAITVGAITLAGAGPSLAADAEQVKAQAGSWLVAPENGAKGCHLTFETGEAAGGHPITGGQTCAAALPDLAGATAWNIGDDDMLAIMDATGKVLLRFGQEEGSPWETAEGDPIWLLPALGDVDHVPSIESLVGTWQLQRPGGEALCQVALLADKDEDGTAKMSLTDGCPSSITDMKLSLWATEGFGLVLMGSEGTALSFDMNAAGNFDKSKEDGGQPLLLIRQ